MITALRGTGSEGCDVVREILTACVREAKTKHKDSGLKHSGRP